MIYEHPEYDDKLRPGPDWDGKKWAYGVLSRWDAGYLLARGIAPDPEGYASFLQDREEQLVQAVRVNAHDKMEAHLRVA